MTRQIPIERIDINPETLRAELRAAVGQWVTGVSRNINAYRVIVEDNAPEDAAEQIAATVAAHDPGPLSESQQIAADATSSETELLAVIAARIQWHIDNPITETSTMTDALRTLARIQAEHMHLLRWVRRQMRAANGG